MRILTAIALSLLVAVSARSEVFHSRESALRLAFPGADSVEKRDVFLDADEAARVEELARSPLASRLVTAYIGWKAGVHMGCAFIETHRVRSLPETIMVVIGSDGRLDRIHVLAFHEPPEYAPAVQWLRQFDGMALNEKLSLRGDVAGITGATLTAHSITAAVRRTLAVYRVGVAPGLPGGGSPDRGSPGGRP